MNLHVSGMDVPCKPPPSPPPPSSPNPPPPPTPHRVYPHPALYQNPRLHTHATPVYLPRPRPDLAGLALSSLFLQRTSFAAAIPLSPALTSDHAIGTARMMPTPLASQAFLTPPSANEPSDAAIALGQASGCVRGAQTLRDSIRCADIS